MMKNALVTGGSRGIGKAISLKLAADGFYVIINYRSGHDEAKETLKQIEEAGGQGELLPFDVSDASQIESTLGGWMEQSDKSIDVLINNAGITRDNLMVLSPGLTGFVKPIRLLQTGKGHVVIPLA